MRKEIIINEVANEIRIAITEDKRLAELYVETPEKERMVGDIYFGRIAKVMPGIRAAFIDLGLKQDAFLHFSDIGDTFNQYTSLIDDDADVDDEDDDDDSGAPAQQGQQNQGDGGGSGASVAPPQRRQGRDSYRRGGRDNGRRQPSIPDLKKGQEIVVQVTKEPVAKKGVRVTSEISLPGRFLVLLPFDGKIGISKKVSNFKEKKRLRHILRGLLPAGFGVIVRTVAMEKDEHALKADLDELLETWREIEQKIKEQTPPTLLYKDMATTSSVIRDLFTDSVDRVVTDSKRIHKEIRDYLSANSAQLVDKVELYRDREPIFDSFGVEKEIESALNPKVWLRSGGYIIIEQTEAMVVIDVNSGRYAAKREQELNSLRTNLEAAREVCHQLRLRDIGGIIVVDFIDLDDERNRKKVYDEIRKEFRRDRAKVTVLPMTEIGLVQITRQRIRQSILHSFSEPCPVCGGGGLVQTRSAILNHIERAVRRFKAETGQHRLTLTVHPSIAGYLQEGTFSRVRKWMLAHFMKIKLVEDEKLTVGDYRLYSPRLDKDVTAEFRT